MTESIGVFADAGGWRVAGPDHDAVFPTRSEALEAALRQARIIAWRGGDPEIVAQEGPGGELQPVTLRPEDGEWPSVH